MNDNNPDPMVHHPDHYKHPSNIECIDVVQYMSFNIGNAVKYLWRADLKGNKIQDLEKAKQYIDFEIKKFRKEMMEKF